MGVPPGVRIILHYAHLCANVFEENINANLTFAVCRKRDSKYLLFYWQAKQREDRTDQEETADSSSHVRHSVAIPYPVPQKSLTVQVTFLAAVVNFNRAKIGFKLSLEK